MLVGRSSHFYFGIDYSFVSTDRNCSMFYPFSYSDLIYLLFERCAHRNVFISNRKGIFSVRRFYCLPIDGHRINFIVFRGNGRNGNDVPSNAVIGRESNGTVFNIKLKIGN